MYATSPFFTWSEIVRFRRGLPSSSVSAIIKYQIMLEKVRPLIASVFAILKVVPHKPAKINRNVAMLIDRPKKSPGYARLLITCMVKMEKYLRIFPYEAT